MPNLSSAGNRQFLEVPLNRLKHVIPAKEKNSSTTELGTDRFVKANLFENFLDDLSGPNYNLLRLGAVGALKEIGWKQIASIFQRGNGEISLPYGAKARVNVSQKQYASTSRFVVQDEVRKMANRFFKEKNQEMVWLETKGTLELEDSFNTTGSNGVSSAAQISSSIKYRKIEPFESPSGAIDKGIGAYRALIIPISASLADEMPEGSEFEIICEGHALLKPKAGSSLDLYRVGPAKLSVDGGVGLLNDLEGDTSIFVQKLVEPGLVMVKISFASGFSTSAYSRFMASVKTYINFPGSNKKTSKILNKILEYTGILSFVDFLSDLNASVSFANNTKSSNRTVKRYVFDLSNSKAHAAYDDIFMKFSTGKADLFANQKGSGIRFNGGSEKENNTSLLYDAKAASSSLGLNYKVDNERTGRFSGGKEDSISFKETKFEKEYFNWFAGKKTISWNSVFLYDEKLKQNQSYYRLTFNNDDRITTQKEVEGFIKFSEALGVQIKLSNHTESSQVYKLMQVLADRDDTLTSLDIYFTDQGIDKINKASSDQLISAYMVSCQKLGNDSKEVPFVKIGRDKKVYIDEKRTSFKLLQRYIVLTEKPIWSRWWNQDEIRELEDKYFALYSRDLEQDTKNYQEAEDFAKQKDLKKFFARLGHSKGFDYTKTIAAMADIAGEKNTIIHELSLSAGGLSLQHRDEGEIIHPEQEVTSVLASLA